MGKVVIHLVGTLRREFKSSTIAVRMEGPATFGQLVRMANTETGRDLAEALSDPDTGEILPHMAVFVNRVNVRQQQGWDTSVKEGDEVIIMRADMAGG